MSQHVPISDSELHLEGFFGPLGADAVNELRAILAATETELAGLADHCGRANAWGRSKGLMVAWQRDGRHHLSGEVETESPDGHEAAFSVMLAPAWWWGECLAEPLWRVDAEIGVECQHQAAHQGGLHQAWEREVVRRNSARAAAVELLEAARELHRLGCEHPLEHWLMAGKDA